jgi:NADH dehydrogenase (ubiquinone) Fe-S protein 3
MPADAQEPSLAPFTEPVGINPADKTANLSSPLHKYGQYLTTCLPRYIQQFSVYKDELTLYIPPAAVVPVLIFLRDHTQCQYKQVMDITAVDFPTKAMRFEVGRSMLSGD